MTQQQPPRPPHWAGPGGRPAAPGQPPHYAAYPPGRPMPPQSPPPPKPLTKRWWFWAIVAVIGLSVLGQCAEANRSAAPGPVASTRSGVRSATPSPATSSAAPAAAATAPSAPQPTPAPPSQPATAPTTETRVGLNKPVTDRDLEFTVTGFDCGVTVKDAIKTLEPQGKFCRIRLTAKNVGSRQTTLSDDQVVLEDAGGVQYSASTDTWLVEGSMFLKAINPGNTLTGVVVIDVPEPVTPTTAVLRAGTYSHGARVTLPRT